MDSVAVMKMLQFLVLWALGYALTFGASVAMAATWSVGSGSFSTSEASGGRSYTYQNVGGVQSWQHDTPGGHSTATYRPAGTPSAGNYVFDNTGTGATARTNVRVPYSPGKYGTASVANAMSKAGIAAAGAFVARGLGAAGTIAALATVYEALQDNGYEAMPDDESTWAKTDPDTAPSGYVNVPVGSEGTGTAWYLTADAARNAVCAAAVGGLANCTTSGASGEKHCTKYTATGYTTKCSYIHPGAPYTAVGYFEAHYPVAPASGCPEGQTYSAGPPAGCWHDGQTRPATPAELAAMDAAIVDGCPGGCGFGPMVPEILAAGGSIPADAFGPTLITIPDSGIWPGDAQTTTHPDGSQTVTDSNYAATGDGDTVEVRKTTTVTEKDSTGAVTGVTTTEGSATSEAPPAEPTPLCEQFPNILACATQDEAAPAVVALGEDVRDVGLLTPETISGGAGSCPAPIEVSAVGQTLSFSYQPVCDLATGIRPVVLILGWLAAGMLLFGGVKGGGD